MALLETPYGKMLPNSKFYVERPPNEEQGCQTIVARGALIRIKAPRQMGKSSLMEYILHYARQQEYRTVTISFQELDKSTFDLENLDRFLLSFCEVVASQLELKYKPSAYWKGKEGSKPKCTSFFQKCVLREERFMGKTKPLVLALDEVDLTFTHLNIAREFLGLLRA